MTPSGLYLTPIKYSLPPDPREWGSDLSLNLVEPDDELHNPRGRMNAIERDGLPLSARGLTNFGCLVILCVGLVTLLSVISLSPIGLS